MWSKEGGKHSKILQWYYHYPVKALHIRNMFSSMLQKCTFGGKNLGYNFKYYSLLGNLIFETRLSVIEIYIHTGMHIKPKGFHWE